MTLQPAQGDPPDRGRTTYPVAGSLITTLIEAVASRAACDPGDLPELNAVVDPDSLDELFAPRANGRPRHGGELVFPYAGYRIRITGRRQLAVEPIGYDE